MSRYTDSEYLLTDHERYAISHLRVQMRLKLKGQTVRPRNARRSHESHGVARGDDWFSCRMQGVENSITECLLKFSSLLSEIRSETANTSRCHDINQSHANCSPWAVGDENPGDKGTAFVHVLVSQFEGHLKEHAETSGLDPELPSVFTLRATYSTFFDQGPGGEKTQASRTY